MTQLIRHLANLGLLFAFATLAVTGVMSFVLPFSITTARVHIVFGLPNGAHRPRRWCRIGRAATLRL
ncbi:MAG: hypothetical protein AAGB26_06515 [Planctomycetota bacterium]